SELIPQVKGKVTTLICMGLDNKKLLDSFTNIIPFIYSTSSLTEAMDKVHTVYKPGDCVLLSPACASFDLFKNYQQRGTLFKEAVHAMQPKTRE
ncbi:MAG: UDP-N-acetylmuramoyl-L-alanine--D-glutamate ligase, partial [Rikenellaceae bacterium]